MIDVQQFRAKIQKASESMNGYDMSEVKPIIDELYSQLHRETYRRRLSKRSFAKVFYGLEPPDVLILLYNKSCVHLNMNEMTEALKTLDFYNEIERDFGIWTEWDFNARMNEMEAHRRIGNNDKAISICDRLLRGKLNAWQRINVLINKGSIETDVSHLAFNINTLSEALAEAEADGTPTLIAFCYSEIAKMIGSHYPAIGLSFLWKSRIISEGLQETERIAFCKLRMAMAYFLLANKTGEECFRVEAIRLVNSDIKREELGNPANQYSFDRLKGVLNCDLSLIEGAMDYFEGIKSYGEFYATVEFYIKTCLTLGERVLAKAGIDRYEKLAAEFNDVERIKYLDGLKTNFDKLEVSWNPPQMEKDMPNLLDVLEMLAIDEERFHLDKSTLRLLYPTHYQEGMFETVQMSDGKVRLYPCSLYPYRYFRGQSEKLEGKRCQPSLFRGLTDAEIFHERLCLNELETLLSYYYLTTVFEKGMLHYNTPAGPKPLYLNVDVTALGQHYGIRTEVLDLTADKWVAAFFASTLYSGGEYLPYEGDGEGVMYVYRHSPVPDESEDRLCAVGLQPFSRPGRQAAVVLRMEPDEDFNDMAHTIFFRHDPAISHLIFNYCNRSKKLFPNEILERKVNEIRASKVYSRWAYTMAIREYYNDVPAEVLNGYVQELGISFQSAPPVNFTKEEHLDFVQKWEKEKNHLFDSLIVRMSESDNNGQPYDR